jgi:hypothetical protein
MLAVTAPMMRFDRSEGKGAHADSRTTKIRPEAAMTVSKNETAEHRAKRLARTHEYDQRPENKARRHARQQTPEWKARARTYRAALKAGSH